MTYLDYIVFFEKCDHVQAFSGNATRLYLKLLHLANLVSWPEEFAKPDPYVAAVCGFSINTMKDCRAQLVAGGLLSTTSGGTGRNAATTYQLLNPSKSDTLPAVNSSEFDGFTAEANGNPSNPDGFSVPNPSEFNGFTHENQLNPSKNPSNFDTLNIDKENNNTSAAVAAGVGASFSGKVSTEQPATKPNSSKKPKKNGASLAEIAALSLPHAEPEFAEAWRTFYTDNTKQVGKPLTAFELMLKKLGKQPAAFAVVMLEAAIQGNWSGVENAGTARAFVEWQAEQARRPSGPTPTLLPTANASASLELEVNEEFEAEQRARLATEAAERGRRFRATYATATPESTPVQPATSPTLTPMS